MRVSVVTPGKFHSLDVARELHARDMLERLYSGYPRNRLSAAGLPNDRIVTVGILHTIHAAAQKAELGPFYDAILAGLYELARIDMSRRTRRKLSAGDVVIAMSGSGLECGREVQRRGGKFVCDRASTHIIAQRRILETELATLGIRSRPVSEIAVQRELTEYETADAIFVPSDYVLRTFLAEGVRREKLFLIPYGVDLRSFQPVTGKSNKFRVLFAGSLSARKGVHYLLDAWSEWKNRDAELVFAGARTSDMEAILRRVGVLPDNVSFLGHLPRDQLVREMSAAHVLVLPSIEEGLALVMAQAMACGTAVVATECTGAETLFTSGEEGLIGPARSPQFILNSLDTLNRERGMLASMQDRALLRSRTQASSAAYGERIVQALREICSAS